jgi:hypothetical protein
MKTLAVLSLAWALVASAGWADPPAAPGAATPAPKPAPPRAFLSPSGEPFRPTPGGPDPFDVWFDQADANHDGVIDKAEFRADAARFFKRLDANGDGIIDGFEIAAYERTIVPELAAQAEGRFPGDASPGGDHAGGARPGRTHADDDHSVIEMPDTTATDTDDHPTHGGRHDPPAPRGLRQLLDEPEPVSGADFDLDGKVSLDEWMRAADRRFDLLDTGKTGQLTRAALADRMKPPAKPKR